MITVCLKRLNSNVLLAPDYLNLEMVFILGFVVASSCQHHPAYCRVASLHIGF